eukprot:3384499-Prymnesium_polylepis.1
MAACRSRRHARAAQQKKCRFGVASYRRATRAPWAQRPCRAAPSSSTSSSPGQSYPPADVPPPPPGQPPTAAHHARTSPKLGVDRLSSFLVRYERLAWSTWHSSSALTARADGSDAPTTAAAAGCSPPRAPLAPSATSA